MAKELPYFQFEPAEYLSGNIQFCSLSAQGLFNNICSIYWQRNCVLTKEQLYRKFGEIEALNELLKENIVKVKNDNVIISFLDKQFKIITNKSLRLSEAGRKGGLSSAQARLNDSSSEASTTVKQPYKIKEDKKKEDKIKIDLSFIPSEYLAIMNKWLGYKKERGETYKGETSISVCCKKLTELSGNNPIIAEKIVDQSIANNWAGLFEYKGKDVVVTQKELPDGHPMKGMVM